jgi:hypothetical protein
MGVKGRFRREDIPVLKVRRVRECGDDVLPRLLQFLTEPVAYSRFPCEIEDAARASTYGRPRPSSELFLIDEHVTPHPSFMAARNIPHGVRGLIMARYDALPPGLVPRGLTREAAAAYAGLSPAAFDKARLEQKYPNLTLPGGRYDLMLLHVAMNRLSGILTESEAASPLDALRMSRGARSP